MELPELIEVNPDLMNGQPCLKGTRIPVNLIVEKLRAGETEDQLLAVYPQLTRDHIRAAVLYAAQVDRTPTGDLPSRRGKPLSSNRRIDIYEDR